MKDKKPLVIQKSNTLIDASFSLTLYESRVLLCCVAQIKPKKKADEMYFLDARRFSELFDLPIDGVYSKLRKAMNSLAERWVRISDENGHPKDIHWIITKQYFDSKGVVGLAFHPEMLPYISELQKHFTQYDIKNISRMRSNYGPMFYELISKRRDLNKQEFSLDFLRTKLRLEDKYCSWKDFKRNVIEPALRDLNAEQGEFKATYKPIKDGRAYVAVVIHYAPSVSLVVQLAISPDFV